MRTLTSSVHGGVDAVNKFTQTAEVLWRKGRAWPLWVREHSTLAWTGFYCFLGTLYQRRLSFIMLRFALGDYFFQITKKRMLQKQGKKWLKWLYSVLGRFSTDFRNLLQRYALNICCLNSGWGTFSKSKPHSSLDIMQAWFSMGKPICGPGSCVLPHACQFSKPGLSYICHCHTDRFPIMLSIHPSLCPHGLFPWASLNFGLGVSLYSKPLELGLTDFPSLELHAVPSPTASAWQSFSKGLNVILP